MPRIKVTTEVESATITLSNKEFSKCATFFKDKKGEGINIKFYEGRKKTKEFNVSTKYAQEIFDFVFLGKRESKIKKGVV